MEVRGHLAGDFLPVVLIANSSCQRGQVPLPAEPPEFFSSTFVVCGAWGWDLGFVPVHVK